MFLPTPRSMQWLLWPYLIYLVFRFHLPQAFVCACVLFVVGAGPHVRGYLNCFFLSWFLLLQFFFFRCCCWFFWLSPMTCIFCFAVEVTVYREVRRLPRSSHAPLSPLQLRTHSQKRACLKASPYDSGSVPLPFHKRFSTLTHKKERTEENKTHTHTHTQSSSARVSETVGG